MSQNELKLDEIVEEEEYDSSEELISDFLWSEYVPGICMNSGCSYQVDVEPMEDSGWCNACNTGTVCSSLILAGVV